MSSKIKNIIIIGVVAIVLVLIYIFFIKKGPDATTLLTTPSGAPATNETGGSATNEVNPGFLSVLLSVKNIKLDDPAPVNIHSGSIPLTRAIVLIMPSQLTGGDVRNNHGRYSSRTVITFGEGGYHASSTSALIIVLLFSSLSNSSPTVLKNVPP